MDHGWRCVRPGCGGPAAALLRYDYAERVVWIDDVAQGPDGSVWPLCQSHADRLRVPVGWTRDDRRARPASEATSTVRPAPEATSTAWPAPEATGTARPAPEATGTAPLVPIRPPIAV
jgi:hypothetical protein